MIRRAAEGDGARLAEIDWLTWSPVSSPVARPAVDAPFFVRGLSPDDVLVAELDGVVTGYVALGRSTRLEANAHVAAIHGLAVAPSFQGRGLARALMRAAVDEARARGARRVTLRVLGDNRRALRLYAGLGFAREGALRGEFLIDGRYVDDILMGLAL